MAALVAATLNSQERQRCLDHLAGCQACYDEWRDLAMGAKEGSGKIIKGPWLGMRSLSLAAAGSLLAAAASLLLYLNITPPAVIEERSGAPEMMERSYPAEKSSDALLKKQAAAPAPVISQMLEKEESAARAKRQERKKKEFAADQDMSLSPPAQTKAAASPAQTNYDMLEEMMAADPPSLPQENEEMVDISNVIPVVLKKVVQLDEGQSLVLQTYKRDRSLTVVRLADQRILVREDGFSKEEFEVDIAKLKKLLKTLVKKEFPRSNKVRMSTGSQVDQ